MTPAQRSTDVVLGMLRESRHAEACLFLFHLNKLHPAEWMQVRDRLMLETYSPKQLSALATLLKCSSRSDLSSCDALVPGLCQYSRLSHPPELLD